MRRSPTDKTRAAGRPRGRCPRPDTRRLAGLVPAAWAALLTSAAAAEPPVASAPSEPPPAGQAAPATPTPATPQTPAPQTPAPQTQPAQTTTTALPPRDPPPAAYQTSPGLSSGGGAGLIGMAVADPGLPWQLRANLWILGFSQSDYLVAGDRNNSLQGGLQLSATLGRYIEAWLTLGASSNRNERQSAYREDPPLILSLGDFALGVKLHSLVGRTLHIGLQPQLRVSSAGGDLGANFATISPGIDLMATVDLRRMRSGPPVRVHLLLGYLQDRSSLVLQDRVCAPGAGVDDCVQSRVVAQAAYGIHQPRVRLGLGADAAFPVGAFALGPMLEYHLEATTGEGDETVRGYLQGRIEDDRRVESRVAQWLTLGGRFHTPINVTVDAGLQLGLSHPGYAMGPALPQAAGYAGLTWTSDLVRRRGEAPRPESAPPVVAAAPQQGRVRGVVRDARTGKPLPGALVRFPGHGKNALVTDERGEYESFPLPPGPLPVEASRDDFEVARGEALVVAGQTGALDLGLAEKVAAPASVRIDVVDDKGQPLAAAVSMSRDGQRVEVPPDIAGGFLAQAAAGTWGVRVDSEGFLSREVQVALTAGGKQKLSVPLRRRPQAPSVRLSGDYVALKGTIGFEPGTAELLPQSQQLLDEVSDLLLHHPEIQRLRVEGHTDNQGKPQLNQQLSEDRAISVRNYLVKQGVAPERMLAEGLGASQPLVPNLTPANRAKNRRIVLKILH